MTRLFVAIWPESAAVEAIAEDLEHARGRHPTLHWQPPHRWHLTVAFLGEAHADRTGATLDDVLAEPPIAEPIRTSGAGTFGSVLWLGVAHGAWLADLARVVQRELRTQDRRFRPHVTIARGRGTDGRLDARRAADDLLAHRGPSWTPDAVTLVASVTGPQPRYEVLDRWPLGSGADRSARSRSAR